MERFPNARAYDCFDNDLAGRVNGLRLMALVEDVPLKITKTDAGLWWSKGQELRRVAGTLHIHSGGYHIPVRYRMGSGSRQRTSRTGTTVF